MSSKSSFYLLSLFVSSCLVVLSVVLYSQPSQFAFYPRSPPYAITINNTVDQTSILNTDSHSDLPTYHLTDSLLTLDQYALPSESTTVILPVLASSIERLLDHLAPFLSPEPYVLEVVIVCPDAIISRVRSILHDVLLSLETRINHPDITLRASHSSSDLLAIVIEAASESPTEWALILDDTGLTGKQDVSVPFVSRQRQGMSLEEGLTWEQMAPSNDPGSYLRPPFFVHTSIVRSFQEPCDTSAHTSWKDFMLYVSRLPLGHNEDMLPPDSNPASSLLEPVPLSGHPLKDNVSEYWDMIIDDPSPANTSNDKQLEEPPSPSSRFLFLLPKRKDLENILGLVCAMKLPSKPFRPEIVIYDEDDTMSEQNDEETHFLEGDECMVEYKVVTIHSAFSHSTRYLWDHSTLDYRTLVDVVFYLDVDDTLVACLTGHMGRVLFPEATFIKIPPSDLDQTQWMSSLSKQAWKNWYKPQVDITVITKDRPHSLRRLLKSLLSARYFGDSVTLRINVEQDCDAETLEIIENIVWPFGPVFIHRRVVHGGLLPAVVESWYPQGNHSYGLLLEDDVELSPLFYAWIKMTVLRYRYSDTSISAHKLFGISLYQQKHLELPLNGRQQFNPRSLFSSAGLRDVNIPYLSQVPCSWGAVYFPEHWREFHDYLALRLTETVMALDAEVVPGVRSNFWSKSWKRFYIELVYLRGYVMLYPNYEDFLSLSTNHLEVGSHVKIRSKEKRNLFLLPLVPLSELQAPCKLLEMPGQTLPDLDSLPLLNLTGSITTFGEISVIGELRRLHLWNCVNPTHSVYDIKSLMCITTPVSADD